MKKKKKNYKIKSIRRIRKENGWFVGGANLISVSAINIFNFIFFCFVFYFSDKYSYY